MDPGEVAEGRRRVRDQYGEELASKASDVFCMAFGRESAPAFGLESVSAAGAPAGPIVMECAPYQDKLEQVRGVAAEVKRSAAWEAVRGSLEEARRPGIRLHTGRMLRQAAVDAVREDFYRSVGRITAEVERSDRNLTGVTPEAAQSAPAGTTEVCWLNRSILTRVDPRSLAEVAADPQIERLDLPRALEAELRITTDTVGAARYRARTGRSGDGVIVAVIDSEVSLRHPAFGDRVVHKRNFTVEPWGTAGDHGTTVAGIVAADGGDIFGMAPGATIFNYKVLATNRFLNGNDFDGALAVQQALEDGAHVANCSWGAGPVSDTLSREARAVDTAWNLGLTVVKSAGNRGPGDGTLTTPADAEGVIVVGATDREGVAVGDYSSRGPTTDGRERPHLLAPGGLPGRGIDSCRVGGGFGDRGHGTSFAAPHVAGILALLLEGDPDLTPAQQRDLLLSACTPLEGFDANTQGAGIVSLDALV